MPRHLPVAPWSNVSRDATLRRLFSTSQCWGVSAFQSIMFSLPNFNGIQDLLWLEEYRDVLGVLKSLEHSKKRIAHTWTRTKTLRDGQEDLIDLCQQSRETHSLRQRSKSRARRVEIRMHTRLPIIALMRCRLRHLGGLYVSTSTISSRCGPAS